MHEVRFGSLAALLHYISRMSASEGKADVFRFKFGSLRFIVRFSPKRTLLPQRNSNFQGPLSARSGRWLALWFVFILGLDMLLS